MLWSFFCWWSLLAANRSPNIESRGGAGEKLQLVSPGVGGNGFFIGNGKGNVKGNGNGNGKDNGNVNSNRK